MGAEVGVEPTPQALWGLWLDRVSSLQYKKAQSPKSIWAQTGSYIYDIMILSEMDWKFFCE